MRVTLRRGFAAPPEPVDCTWRELCDFLRGGAPLQYSRKEDVPLILFGSCRGFHEQEIDWLCCLTLDFDGVSFEAFQSALEFCHANSSHGFAHTTWSNGTPGDAIYARIILPIDGPDGTPGEGQIATASWGVGWERFTAALFAASGAQSDPSCKNASRCWYVPATNTATPHYTLPVWIEEW